MSEAGKFAIDFFGNEYDAAREWVVFLFCLGAVQSARKSSNRIHQLAQVTFRTLGYPGVGLALPLVLGKLPGELFNNGRIGFDTFLYLLVGSIAFNELFLEHMPQVIKTLFKYITNVFHCVVLANSVGLGFDMASEVITDSWAAGVFGAFLAANGFQILNAGLNYVGGTKHSHEAFIGFFGAFVYMFLTQYMQTSAVVSRVVLVVLRLLQESVDYNAILEYCAQAFDLNKLNPLNKWSSMRSRSSSSKKSRRRSAMKKRN